MPDRVIAGVGIGGVHVSDDQGECRPSVTTESTRTSITSSFSVQMSTSPLPVMDSTEQTMLGCPGRVSTRTLIISTSAKSSCSMVVSTWPPLAAHREPGAGE
ncbi:hypothetical protein [Halocatena marina]|uniref:hypothetical protein n=1 Tax=Halocatena marina TaxID=2934937 RepID=UPI00200CC9A9|nr:hypothetical protein [Halocatena marina]